MELRSLLDFRPLEETREITLTIKGSRYKIWLYRWPDDFDIECAEGEGHPHDREVPMSVYRLAQRQIRRLGASVNWRGAEMAIGLDARNQRQLDDEESLETTTIDKE